MTEAADLDADYHAAGFGGRLPFGKKAALLVIDVVEAYLDKTSPLYAGVEDARDSNIRLVDSARAAGVPVIFTNVLYSAGGADGGVFYRKVPALKCFLGHGPFGAFPPGLVPREDGRLLHLGLRAGERAGRPAARLHPLCGARSLRRPRARPA